MSQISMKTITVGLLLALPLLNAPSTQAQAPTSIAGNAFALTLVDGVPPFITTGYALLLPASSGGGYTYLSISDLSGSSGTYTYLRSNADGYITANDSSSGLLSGDFTFSDPFSGTFLVVDNASGGYQEANFIRYAGQAPASLSGKTFDLTIIDGGGGADSSGSYAVAFTASGFTLTDPGGVKTGTYTYAIANTSTAKITARGTGSVNVNTVWVSFADANHGGYASTNTDGSYEVGTFTVPDTTAPTLQITAPTAGLTVSNANYTIAGKASDNLAVAKVFYSLNAAGWQDAQTVNQWSNWTAAVTLVPGTNTIAAYALDASGNPSTTNTVKMVYVLSAILTVRTNGLGTLNPNYNGAALQIGHGYSITATATAGSAFTNWTGGTGLPLSFITNGATIQFVMQSNLVLQANFVDVTRPTLAITSPTAGQRWSNELFTARGTAGDNAQLAHVFVGLNGGDWIPASSTNGWTNWTAAIDLVPGTNTLAAYAVDATGNSSLTNRVAIDRVVTNLLSVRTIGLGTLSPNYSNTWLEVGRNYSMTATAGAGFTFSNWQLFSNGVPLLQTNGATLQFMMQSNLALQASFVDVTKPTLAISAPTAGQHLTNALASVRGTAGDNWKVTAV